MKKILVIGDSCEDVFVYGSCDRLCPDAPVPVFIPKKTIQNGGMAKNVYENILSIYPHVELITNKKTITKTRYVEQHTNQMLVRVDSEETLLERIENLREIDLSIYHSIIISDYCKGFLTEEDIRFICDSHSNVFVDTKKILGPYCKNAKIIKINEIEYNNNIRSNADLSIFDSSLLVTLGSRGCKFQNKIYPVDKVEIKDMSGAGDTFISCLVVEMIKSGDIDESINEANRSATIIVQQKGVNRIGEFINK